MALIKCKECGEEISKKAKQCPKCGALGKKKTSLFTWIVTIIFGLWFIGYLSDGSNIGSSGPAPAPDNPTPPPKSPSPKEVALKNVELDFKWRTSALGNIMEADFTIKNKSKYDIKDIEIKCTHFAKSGTQIDSNTRTIYDSIMANSSKVFTNFNMGFIHSQVNASSCSINDLMIM